VLRLVPSRTSREPVADGLIESAATSRSARAGRSRAVIAGTRTVR
jgi:hypothetical protein